MNYIVVRTFEVGNVVRDGVVMIRQFEHICRNHPKAIAMKNDVRTEGKTVEAYVECPECKLTILEGFYEEN